MDKVFIIDRDYFELVNMTLTYKKEIIVPYIGKIKFPSLKEIDQLSYYRYLVEKYCSIYNDKKALNAIFIQDDIKTISEIKEFILFFIDCEDVSYSANLKAYLCGTDLKINEGNFNFFIGVIKIGHHLMEKSEYYALPENKKNREYILEVRRRKKELKKKQEKYAKNHKGNQNSDGLKMSNLISAVCARHPSINNLNVSELTYYQLISNFKMLNKIDKFNIDIKAIMAGGENIKLKHYTE